MAKPIFIMHVLQNTSRDKLSYLTKSLNDNIGQDYHTLVINDIQNTENKHVFFECFNDCKGLADKDVEKLLLEIINKIL